MPPVGMALVSWRPFFASLGVKSFDLPLLKNKAFNRKDRKGIAKFAKNYGRAAR
jgi:hypothetical protein